MENQQADVKGMLDTYASVLAELEKVKTQISQLERSRRDLSEKTIILERSIKEVLQPGTYTHGDTVVQVTGASICIVPNVTRL